MAESVDQESGTSGSATDRVGPPPPRSAEERFVTLAERLAVDIRGITAGVNEGALTFDGAVAAIEDLFARFPAQVHLLAEDVKAGSVPP